MESNLSRRLAAVDKKTRDQAVKSLTAWLTARSELTDLDLMKLWKALFYCYWLSDKPLIQQELAERLSKIAQQVPAKLGLRYIQAFWQTIVAEWHGIDRLRLDKFYNLCRWMQTSAFKLLEQNAWDQDCVDKYLQIMMEGPLHSTDPQVPDGLRYHTTERFMELLEAALTDNVPCEVFTTLLTPFVLILAESRNKLALQRVRDEVFGKMMAIVDHEAEEHGDCCCDDEECQANGVDGGHDHDDENITLDSSDDEADGESKLSNDHAHQQEGEDEDDDDDDVEMADPDTVLTTSKLQIYFPDIVAMLFEVASHEDTHTGNRRAMYELVREIKARYDIQLVDDDVSSSASSSETGETAAHVNGNGTMDELEFADEDEEEDEDWEDVTSDESDLSGSEDGDGTMTLDELMERNLTVPDDSLALRHKEKKRKRGRGQQADDDVPMLIPDPDLADEQGGEDAPSTPKKAKKNKKNKRKAAPETPVTPRNTDSACPPDSDSSKKKVAWGMEKNTVKYFNVLDEPSPQPQPVSFALPKKTALRQSPSSSPSLFSLSLPDEAVHVNGNGNGHPDQTQEQGKKAKRKNKKNKKAKQQQGATAQPPAARSAPSAPTSQTAAKVNKPSNRPLVISEPPASGKKRNKKRVRTKTVKKASRVLIEKYYPRLTLDFQTNKKLASEVAIIPSKRLRNKIAGFTTHLMRRIQKGPVRGISFKLQEEERERKDNYVPETSALDMDTIEVDQHTEELLKSLNMTLGNIRVKDVRQGGEREHKPHVVGGNFRKREGGDRPPRRNRDQQ
ncbi:hypothetical protein RI367_000693 [Sorochytrium milnesiophthora]